MVLRIICGNVIAKYKFDLMNIKIDVDNKQIVCYCIINLIR